ncbi:flagellar motor switch protein FliN/FliY [Tindallia magadiensis]|uniref:Flagellar motor switch protein FliN/FliY n=1 Tax=Tindallia magadiensis TaxID=69895 RepID=A0A1I3AJ80_9FIRM|nr:flagellar motor switch phosphatase FliY [Tindallia magadiensis]SFH50050.1 flagellar motor switch protein FliN/FliY [Tindallia magadiensis]
MMSDMLSQEEIDALLSGGGSDSASDPQENNESVSKENFTDQEKDTIGEIGNISMGTAATTLSTLLNHKVVITTPKVSMMSLKEIADEYPVPFVAVEVKYKEGIEGTNLMVLRENDVKIITNLMMGQEPDQTDDPISDLHLSAIAEAMNQMVGSSATSLSEMFMKKIDISPPKPFRLDMKTPDLDEYFSDLDENIIRISFRMEIEGLIDSEIMQLIPLDFAKEMVRTLMPESGDESLPSDNDVVSQPPNNTAAEQQSEQSTISKQESSSDQGYDFDLDFDSEPKSSNQKPRNVNVQPAHFQSFDEQPAERGIPENISLIQDVPLKVTVELGRTVKKINEVLEFGPGTIVELDRVVGEPLDIMVNGQYVAKGEVVVIDENYGIRITDIVNPNKRFSKI